MNEEKPDALKEVAGILKNLLNIGKGAKKEFEPAKEEKKVLGMPPFVGYTAIGVVVFLTGFVAYKYMTK